MSSVLQVENINVYYGSIHAVKDVSFHVEQGLSLIHISEPTRPY